MRNRPGNGAFTLIELLIVVAIIAILAMIAIPNFLEAQVRAKVSRSKTDQRTIALGMQALYTDKHITPVDFWDDDQNAQVVAQLLADLGTPNQSHDNRGGTCGVLVPLTTPIPYITSIPEDPFATDDIIATFYRTLIREDKVRPYVYFYIDDDAMFGGRDHGCEYFDPRMTVGARLGIRPIPKDDDKFITCGLGPLPTWEYQQVGIQYDPTNGTASGGQIIRYFD